MPTTLIVVYSASQADALRKQIGENASHIKVCHALAGLAGHRFDTIVISDNYQREMFFMEEHEREAHKEWINTTLFCRLSSPNARLIEL